MNIIEGQAKQKRNASLIFYSLTFDNILNIIILLVIAGISINSLLGENGIITKASMAKVNTQIASLKEEVDLYKIGQELIDKEGIDRYPVIKNETLESVDKNELNMDLKNKMSKWANLAQNGQIATVDTIDYSKFYKIDKTKVSSANDFSGELYLIEVNGSYKVISIEGIKYASENINVIIPLKDIDDPKYITVANNTYKLYGDGKLSVVGELAANSGITNEDNKDLYGWQELDLKAIAKGTTMAFDNNVSTSQNIAKKNGVKKIYLNSGTAYVIDANDELWAWGENSYNKLGQGNSFLITEPTKILEGRTSESNVKVKNVWAGPTNVYLLDTNNQLWASGTNINGELGQGNFNIYNNFVKVQISGLDFKNIEDIVLPYYGDQVSATIIKCSNGKIYAAGCSGWGGFGIGYDDKFNTFIELTSKNELWANAKTILNAGVRIFMLNESGELYGAGHNGGGELGLGDNYNKSNLQKIADNVKEAQLYNGGYMYLSEDGYLYMIQYGQKNKVNGFQNSNAHILCNRIIVVDKKMYYIDLNGVTLLNTEYETTEDLNSGYTRAFISNDKIYAYDCPNITKLKQKAIYTLKEVASNIQFVQGSGKNLNLVDTEGDIYEGLNNKNTEIKNIKKLTSGINSNFAIGEEGFLYVKGSSSMLGNLDSVSNYQKIAKSNGEELNNVKDIYVSKQDIGSIFITEDNKIYWGGATAVTALPNIKGEIFIPGMGKYTIYPEEVNSTKLNEISNKIKDIKFTYVNSAGVWGGNTLVLTDDGKLYTYGTNPSTTGLNKTSEDFEQIEISNEATVKQIDTLGGFSIALLSNGDVYGWGYNTYGLLGDGYEIGAVYSTPVKLKLSNVSYLNLGNGFAIFATNAGEVYGIGKNDYGQLGTGDDKGANSFVRCVELEK